MRPVNFFSGDILATGSGGHLQNVYQAHFNCLLIERLTSRNRGNNLPIRFNQDSDCWEEEVLNKKTSGVFYVKDLFKRCFRVCRASRKWYIYGLGYFDSQKGYIDHDVENREGGVDAKIDTKDFGRYVPPYRAGTLDYVKQRKNKTSRVPTELKHIKICYCKNCRKHIQIILFFI